MAYPEKHYTITETAKDLPTYTAESTDQILARQADGKLGYILVSDLQVTLDGDGLALDTDLTDGSINAVFNTVKADVNGLGTNFSVGDDAYIGDINVVNTLQVKGQQDETKGYIQFGSGSNMPKIGGSGANHLNIANIPAYANNAAALSGGLVAGDIYRLSDYLAIVH
jgi:hypothetical protein